MSLRENFVDRHIGPDQKEIASMLADIGEPTLDALIRKVVPENIAMR